MGLIRDFFEGFASGLEAQIRPRGPSPDFPHQVKRLCDGAQLPLVQMDENRAVIEFERNGDAPLWLVVFDSSPLETCAVIGDIAFRAGIVPAGLTEYLMERSYRQSFGLWCLHEHAGFVRFIVQERIPLFGVEPHVFGNLVLSLLHEYEEIARECRGKGLLR